MEEKIKIVCPACQGSIDPDEVIDILTPEPEDVTKEGEVTFVYDKILVKKRGFGPDSYSPVFVRPLMCPYCGVVFVPDVRERMAEGIKDDKKV